MESSGVDNIITDFIYEAGGVKMNAIYVVPFHCVLRLNHNVESPIQILSHNSPHTLPPAYPSTFPFWREIPPNSPDQFSRKIKFAFLRSLAAK